MEEHSLWKTLLSSFISVFILSLLSIVNLCLVPILNLNHRLVQTLLDFLIALSIGSLLGDVFLHLIPKVYEDAHEFAIPSVYLELMVLLGIWLFFVFEKMLQHYHHGHGHDHHPGGHNHGHANEHLSETDVSVNEAPLRPSALANVHGSSVLSVQKESPESKQEIQILIENDDLNSKFSSSPQSQSSSMNSSMQSISRAQQPIGFLLLFSDALHNFVDGLAIGISFAASTQAGISTSIAILFHEIPHELGDYVILVSSGFSKFKALFYSIIANFSGFIGALLGALLNQSEGVRPWIISFTAGNFLYLSLSDLVPELLHAHNNKEKSRFVWITQNLGLLLGALLMLLLRIYE